MKKVLVAIMVAMLAAGSYAAEKSSAFTPNINEGTSQLEGSGSYDADTALGHQTDFSLGYGYFVADGLEVKAVGAIQDNKAITTYQVGGVIEYFLDLGLLDGRLVPSAGIGGLYAHADRDSDYGGGNADTGIGRVFIGPNYFLTEDVSLALRSTYSWSSDDLWVDDNGKPQDNNWLTTFGISFFFD